jgi:putative phosphoribosyl transferase
MTKFKDRKDAGQKLTQELRSFDSIANAVILALPRGGVPVAYEVAKELNLPLDVFLVRKLGIPGHEETAMGAIALNNILVLDKELIDNLGITQQSIELVLQKEKMELDRRNQEYRKGAIRPDLINRTIILIDDGLATGSTMMAAIKALEKHHVERIIVAVPVASQSACDMIKGMVYKTICLLTPDNFYAVGLWYEQFPQVSDEEVKQLLKKSKPVL